MRLSLEFARLVSQGGSEAIGLNTAGGANLGIRREIYRAVGGFRAMPCREDRDLIDRVIARSGVKPRYVRPVVDALLVELGEMLEEAETMQLQPLGTVKVQRRKDVTDGEVIITKVKRKKDTPEGDDPLAAAAE